MKFTLRGASSAAIIAGLAGAALPVWAQEAPAAGPQATVDQTAPQTPQRRRSGAERVIVTGSFIQGSSEARRPSG